MKGQNKTKNKRKQNTKESKTEYIITKQTTQLEQNDQTKKHTKNNEENTDWLLGPPPSFLVSS